MANTAVGGRPSRGALPALRLLAPTSRGAALILFIVRRLLWMVPIVFFVILITFVLMHLAPGSPWDRAGGRQLSPAVVQNLNIGFGLSYQYQGKTVDSLLLGSWGYTFTFGVLAFVLIVVFGIGLGVIGELRQNTRVDYLAMSFST